VALPLPPAVTLSGRVWAVVFCAAQPARLSIRSPVVSRAMILCFILLPSLYQLKDNRYLGFHLFQSRQDRCGLLSGIRRKISAACIRVVALGLLGYAIARL